MYPYKEIWIPCVYFILTSPKRGYLVLLICFQTGYAISWQSISLQQQKHVGLQYLVVSRGKHSHTRGKPWVCVSWDPWLNRPARHYYTKTYQLDLITFGAPGWIISIHYQARHMLTMRVFWSRSGQNMGWSTAKKRILPKVSFTHALQRQERYK